MTGSPVIRRAGTDDTAGSEGDEAPAGTNTPPPPLSGRSPSPRHRHRRRSRSRSRGGEKPKPQAGGAAGGRSDRRRLCALAALAAAAVLVLGFVVLGTAATGGGREGPPPPSASSASSSLPDGGAKWTEAAVLDGLATAPGGGVASVVSLSLDGRRLAAVEPAAGGTAGATVVRTYERSSAGEWAAVGTPPAGLPGGAAALSGDGTVLAVARAAADSVSTYRLSESGQWVEVEGGFLPDLWAARTAALSADGTGLVVGHHPDPVCRACAPAATVFSLSDEGGGGGEAWVREASLPVWGEGDPPPPSAALFDDYSLAMASDGSSLAFSGRTYRRASSGGRSRWRTEVAFPTSGFPTTVTALAAGGDVAAVAVPGCRLSGQTPGCTDSPGEGREVSVLERRGEGESEGESDNAATGGGDDYSYWERRGRPVGPGRSDEASTTAAALSADGTVLAVAVAVGTGVGAGAGEGPVPGVDHGGGSFLGGSLEPPLPTAAPHKWTSAEIGRDGGGLRGAGAAGSSDTAVAEPPFYVRVHRYDAGPAESEGLWNTDAATDLLTLEAAASTVALSADGTRLAVGIPGVGPGGGGRVRVFDLVPLA